LNFLGDWASRKELLRASHLAARGLRELTGVARAAEPVLAMGMVSDLSRRWRAEQNRAVADARRAMLRSRGITSITRSMRMAMTGVMVALGLVLVLTGEASSGSMVAGNMILARLLLPFEQISASFRVLVEAGASWQRLRGVLDVPLARRYTTALPRPSGALVVERLAYIPPGSDRPVLRGLSFTLPPAQVLGIVGPSGVGKSTLLRLILGMAQPTSGGVFFDGHNTFLWEREDFARHVGYLPQSLALTDGTVAEAIARLQTPDYTAVRDAARLAGVHDVLAALPQGYATPLSDFTVSGGQRQRIALARALYGNPALLVLDEPTAFLDKGGEALLCALLPRLRARGIGAIMVTYRPALVDACDQLLVLRDGLIDQCGAKDDVLRALQGPPVNLVQRETKS
jgi:ATP-binding cassette subfamily C protein